MYSYEDRIRVIKLYIKLGKRTRLIIRKLGSTAMDFAASHEIHVLDGKALRRGMEAQVAATAKTPVLHLVQSTPAIGSAEVPNCPLGESPMVKRQARRETDAQMFWGCSQFAQTHCRGTRKLA